MFLNRAMFAPPLLMLCTLSSPLLLTFQIPHDALLLLDRAMSTPLLLRDAQLPVAVHAALLICIRQVRGGAFFREAILPFIQVCPIFSGRKFPPWRSKRRRLNPLASPAYIDLPAKSMPLLYVLPTAHPVSLCLAGTGSSPSAATGPAPLGTGPRCGYRCVPKRDYSVASL